MHKKRFIPNFSVVFQWKGLEWTLKVNKERSSLDSSLRMDSLTKLCLTKRGEEEWFLGYNDKKTSMGVWLPQGGRKAISNGPSEKLKLWGYNPLAWQFSLVHPPLSMRGGSIYRFSIQNIFPNYLGVSLHFGFTWGGREGWVIPTLS